MENSGLSTQTSNIYSYDYKEKYKKISKNIKKYQERKRMPMLEITKFTCENLENNCITDKARPRFSFTTESDINNSYLKSARLFVNGWSITTDKQIGIIYGGEKLKPFTVYEAKLEVTDNNGETASKTLLFETGRMQTKWEGRWISDASYSFKEKKISPKPMTFKKSFKLDKKVKSARIYATALGIYELMLNGKKVGDTYFAPGFTSYKSYLQYQTYDITGMLGENNTLLAVVSGGWAVGSFVFTRKNRISADRQALLMELHIVYEDGERKVIKSDESFEVSEEGNYKEADLYDGETYDATLNLDKISWKKASIENPRVKPQIIADYGMPVKAHEIMKPQSVEKINNQLIYDFGQNFAGVVSLKINGSLGQKIIIKHAEILNQDKTLNTAFLRTAKACATYICKDGEQTYSPRLTYMGFRYISIEGIEEKDIEVSALALYSDLEKTGDFKCSNEKINRLQENIIWSSKSNFLDIPTDCPQRDERMGWTGDIAVFAPTACSNFNMNRFLEKWLKDVRAEQLPTGGIPNTVPSQGYGFPATMPAMAVDFWGDACVLVPWAMYLAYGDKNILKTCYPMMKKYVNACKFWAGLTGTGSKRYIWNTPSVLHFGDWIAPDVKKMSQWQKRSKWTATASLRNTSKIVSKIAKILDNEEDMLHYEKISENTAKAYRDIFTDGNGKMKEEFQTAYVLALYMDILKGREKENAAQNLTRLVEKSNYCIGTGFPGTPYILFALADNGHADTAYKMLMNEKCPSWLYEVKMGATTIWERWDGLDENGMCPIGDDGTDLMISYNHYASGAVGDFFYRRIAGIEPILAGYKKFKIKPVAGGGLTFAKGEINTPYGLISSEWEKKDNKFILKIKVPMGTSCEVTLPNGKTENVSSGKYSFEILV